MKKGIRFTVVVIISLLYCYASSRVNTYLTNPVIEISSASNPVSFYQANSVSKFYHVFETKTSVNTFNNNLPSNEKQFNEFNFIVGFREWCMLNKITSILFHESQIFVSFPKTSIIFPFHYFW